MVAATHIYPAHGEQFVSREMIKAGAPSIFAGGPSTNVSEHYRFYSTAEVLDAMIDNGFSPTYAGQVRCRKEGKMPFAKHTIRFRNENAPSVIDPRSGSMFPEIVLRNAHDGSSSYRLDLGFFSVVCANGLVVGNSMFETINVRHSGKAALDVVERARFVMGKSNEVARVTHKWSRIKLTAERVMTFAKEAAALRFGEDAGRVDPHSLLLTRRDADKADNLWTVFNRVQENTTRGGFNLTPRTRELSDPILPRLAELATPRRSTARSMRDVDGTVKFNKRLWDLAEDFAEAA